MRKITSAITVAALGALVSWGSADVRAEETAAKDKAKSSETQAKVTNAFKEYQKVLEKLRKEMKNFTPNMVQPEVSQEAKQNMMRTMMSMSPLGLRQMIGMMALKRKVEEGITFDEVIESMKTRANQENMQLVGHNVPYKLLRQIYDPKSPRMEILSFCDMITLRQIVDVVPEFIIFLPCRIAVLEDAKGDIWLITLDWDVNWLGKDEEGKVPFLTDTLAERARKVNKAIKSIMDAGATGDL